jgi:hypothetical protein
VNEPNRRLDDSIAKVLEWRATRAEPGGLLELIQEELELEPRRPRHVGWSGRVLTMNRLAWLGILVALLAAAALGATVAGGRLGLPAVAPQATPGASAAEETSVGSIYCTRTRALPFASSTIDLSGAWNDGSELFFLRQAGDVVWGVGLPVLAVRDTLPLSGGRYTALHGTVRAGKTVHLDIGEVGSIDPEDKAFAPVLANGSIDLREGAGSDGNVQLTTISSTGILVGPAFKDPIFSPCIPTATP